MKDYLFIVNIIAGGNKSKAIIPIIEDFMTGKEHSYEIEKTSYSKEATNIVEQNIEKYKVFVAVGGDGTINEVCQGLINKKKGKLGIIPGGTGNDLARDLGIPLEPSKSLKNILNGKVMELDVGKANGYNFMNIASIGYDAEVINNYNKFRNRIHGKLSYIFSVIYTLIGFKSINMEFEIDGEKFKGAYTLLAIGNGKYYGGGFKILPDAIINDGNLHLCTITHLSKLKIILLFPTILFGKHVDLVKYVKIYKVKNLKIKLNKPIWLNLDGELVEKTRDVNFSLERYKVKLIS